MEAQTPSSSVSARNHLDIAYNKQQLRQQKLANRADFVAKQRMEAPISAAALPVEAPIKEAIRPSPEHQVLLTQLWMAPLVYTAMHPPVRPDVSFNPKQAQRIENALAQYQAIASVDESGPGNSLACTV
jgi:hypothetical protein